MFHMIKFYETGVESSSLFEIAASHSEQKHNIEPALYDVWLEALIKTIEELDPEYDDDVELAWRLVLTPGITLMKHYHKHSIR